MQGAEPTIRACTRPVVYVAGPFRGDTHWEIWKNIMSAADLALRVWKTGAVCVCPHMNTFPYQHELPDAVWLDGDLCILDRCDAIVMTANWRTSQGAAAEYDYAMMIGIPVFHETEVGGVLKEWVDAFRRDSNDSSNAGDGGAKQGLRKSLRRLFAYRKAVPSA